MRFGTNCEAQGKGRAKGRPRKVTQRSFIDGGWWMVDGGYPFPELHNKRLKCFKTNKANKAFKRFETSDSNSEISCRRIRADLPEI